LAITWQGERLAVEQILDAWREPDGKSYRISTQNGQVFDLHYSESKDAWSIVER
jgi:hypothetical protein